MHRISLAPVLSATLSRDSCWIIYSALCTISATRQRLAADRGRVSNTRTRSPTLAFCSSWALSLVVRLIVLPYKRCWRRSSTSTTTVFSILSETTTPVRVLRFPRAPVGVVAASWSAMPVPSVLPTAAKPALGRGSHGRHRGRHGLAGELPLPDGREDAGDVLADVAQPVCGLELTVDVLEAELVQLLLGLGQLRHPLVAIQVDQFPCLHRITSPSPRASRTCTSPAACWPPAAWPPARSPRERRRARTSPGRASPRPPTTRASPCRSPCGSRPASW